MSDCHSQLLMLAYSPNKWQSWNNSFSASFLLVVIILFTTWEYSKNVKCASDACDTIKNKDGQIEDHFSVIWVKPLFACYKWAIIYCTGLASQLNADIPHSDHLNSVTYQENVPLDEEKFHWIHVWGQLDQRLLQHYHDQIGFFMIIRLVPDSCLWGKMINLSQSCHWSPPIHREFHLSHHTSAWSYNNKFA